jgi:polyketide biosynthesis enoyl-CoA hydratase PksH
VGTLKVTRTQRCSRLTICRPDRGNSINARLVRELNDALTDAESDPECRTIVLEGSRDVFCTGMDFEDAMAGESDAAEEAGIAGYMRLLRRFLTTPRVIVSLVDGKVIAGGVGLVAASDYAICTARAEFSLSEALWGLLPCCVLPFLIRRVGFQKAYTMTLTTRRVSADAALDMHLADELTDDPEDALRRLTLRLNLLHTQTIADLKGYFDQLTPISPEVEDRAVREITRLSNQPRVRQNIANYVTHGRFPWDAPARPLSP